MRTIVAEARSGILTGVVTTPGNVLMGAGTILMVAGIIARLTMVMTATLDLETDKGNLEVALGIILLFLLLSVNDAGWRDSPRPSRPGVD